MTTVYMNTYPRLAVYGQSQSSQEPVKYCSLHYSRIVFTTDRLQNAVQFQKDGF